ncbi:MAG: hypothetical protein WCE74_26795 [Pseudolabrys sp.]
MVYQYGGLFQAYCDDEGNLRVELLRKVFEKDAELNAAEQKFWLLHQPEDFNSVN